MSKTRPHDDTIRKRHKALVFNMHKLGFSVMGDRISDCGRVHIYKCSECDERAGRVLHHCKHALCPFCTDRIASKRANLRNPQAMKLLNPHLMTLKVPNSENLKELYHSTMLSWRRLQRSVEYKMIFPTGFVYLETTYNESKKLWGFHIHIIVEVATGGTKWEHELLFDMWQRATRNPLAWTDLEPLTPDSANGLVNALEYPTKPPNIYNYPEAIKTWLGVMSRRKSTWTYGRLRTNKEKDVTPELPEELSDASSHACPHCGAIDSMSVTREQNGPRKTWARANCKPIGNGWYTRRAPPG